MLHLETAAIDGEQMHLGSVAGRYLAHLIGGTGDEMLSGRDTAVRKSTVFCCLHLSAHQT